MGIIGAAVGAPRQLLLFSLVFLGTTISLCLLRGILGPKFTDRIVAVNMIGTKTILLIAALTLVLGENYLLDVCLVYAMVSFLAVVVLSKIYLTSHNRDTAEKALAFAAGQGTSVCEVSLGQDSWHAGDGGTGGTGEADGDKVNIGAEGGNETCA